MIARKYCMIGVVCSLMLPGCIVETRDFEALRDQVRIQQKQINDFKARQEEQGLRVDTLNDGFKILSDKAEENALRIDDLGEMDTWTAAPNPAEPAAAPAEAAATAPQPPATPVPAPPAVVEKPILLTNLPKPAAAVSPGDEFITAGPKPEHLYAGALKLYSSRDYQKALGKFQEFVAEYPDHKLAGNAQYWTGECHYSQKRFAEAAEEFAKVEKNYPANHPKVPAALLKKGLSLAELKRMPEAQAALQRILERYAQSEEAAKAKEKLERWKQP